MSGLWVRSWLKKRLGKNERNAQKIIGAGKGNGAVADTIYNELNSMHIDLSTAAKYKYVMDLFCRLYDIESESERFEHISDRIDEAKTRDYRP